MAGLPQHVHLEIIALLSEIQSIFKPGAKVMLVVDNGTPALSLMMGDADMDRVVSLMAALSAPPTTPGGRTDG